MLFLPFPPKSTYSGILLLLNNPDYVVIYKGLRAYALQHYLLYVYTGIKNQVSSTSIYYYEHLGQIQKVINSLMGKVEHELDGENHPTRRGQGEECHVDGSFSKDSMFGEPEIK